MNGNQDQFSMNSNQHPKSEIVWLTNTEILTDLKSAQMLTRTV
jgi:hypothetical protein